MQKPLINLSCRLMAGAVVLFCVLPGGSVRAGTKWVSGIEAQRVLGQNDFTSSDPDNSISRIRLPEAIAIDPTTGKLFVADTGNNRILRFGSYETFLNGADAEAVVGQSTFEATGGRNARDGLFTPSGIFIDNDGRLWVADRNNNRILRYENASSLGNGPLADGFLGTTDYGIGSAGTSQSRVWHPVAITGDAAGNLFVVEISNNRVLMFADAANLADGADASLVLGQEDFVTTGVATQQDNFFSPSGITLDPAGNLYVSDMVNNRVLRFDDAAQKVMETTRTPFSGRRHSTRGLRATDRPVSLRREVSLSEQAVVSGWETARTDVSWFSITRERP